MLWVGHIGDVVRGTPAFEAQVRALVLRGTLDPGLTRTMTTVVTPTRQ